MDKNDANEYLLKLALEECHSEVMLKICFSKDTSIDKKKLLDFFTEKVSIDETLTAVDKNVLHDFITVIDRDPTKFRILLRTVKEKLEEQICISLGYQRNTNGAYNSLSPQLFWPMVVIAMKKCLGMNNSKAIINDIDAYFGLISDTLNPTQKYTHEKCIQLFSIDANSINMKNTADLRKYLHPFRSENKRPKTQKKNLQRVVKRVRKIMQVYKLSHNGISGNILSDGRYRVPDQFAECIKKLFIN